ncbi:MAG TPA: S1/P1 nuclease [Chthoniobacterales bacterium]|nr:S1/P1 nuclease [Chthoniobacterales bacterium]
MSSIRRELLIAISIATVRTTLFAYGPTGHEIVGGIADKLIANTPAGGKISALIDGITLEKAAFIPDEIKAWDKNGVDDPKAFPHYHDHAKIDKQLRDFWRANPPTQDTKSPIPSHHWFHYTDVPVLNVHRYSDGTTGRTQWDIVHMISYCVEVLRGEVPENNPRKITKPAAVILLAHYVGDIHQPLHVGAEYFNQAGHAVDPDNNQPGVEDEGGNTLMLQLIRGTPEEMAHRGLKLHGFWDYDAVMANLPPLSPTLSKEKRYQKIDQAKRNLIDRLVKEQPQNWRAPPNIALKNYGEFWADDILPVAREAHERLQFINVHQTLDQDRTVMAGDAREKNVRDNVGYADWSAKIVREELHKAGWRLADLLTEAVTSTSTTSAAPVVSESVQSGPNKAEPSTTPTAALAAFATAASQFGEYPANYKEIVSAWMKANRLDASRIDWQGDPKPSELAAENGRRLAGYLVIFNTPDRAGAKTRSVLIRDGAVVNNSGF